MRSARETSSAQSSSGPARVRQQPNEAADLEPLLELQQSAGNQALLRLLGGGTLQKKSKLSQPTDAPEQEADLIAARIVANDSGPVVQRKCAACAVGAPCSSCSDEEREERVQRKGPGLMLQRAAREGAESGSAANAGVQTETSAAPAKAKPSLIVEDEAKEVMPGQMRKSEFLSQLRSAVSSTAEQALAGTMWSAMGCPYIERWLDHYSKQPSAYVERALRKYAPETASARSAAEYIPVVTQRLRRGVEEWKSTGEVADLPEEFAGGEMPGATVGGLVGGLLSGVGSAISGLVSGAGKALSSVGSMLFKRHEGAEAEPAEDPAAIQAQLGGGHSLDGATRRRMQSAFGVDFARVRVHTDTRARELTEGMQARAFTIGSDIAFGGEEYQPGTPVGDALIAHELAHVVQQGGGSAATTAQHKGGESGSLEEDADRSAVGAVVKLWSGARGDLSELGQRATPNLRSGLRLQRCGGTPKKTESTTPGAAATPVALSGDWAKDVKTATDPKNPDAAMMLALVKKALEPKYTVNLAGNSSSKKESPKDYKKTPIINFDPNLNSKEKFNKNKVMTENAGHSFEDGNDVYAIVGPKSLKTSSPLDTVMTAEHEFFHTTHHLGAAKPRLKPGEKGPTDDDEETETYTNDFVNYFAQLGAIVPGPDSNPRYIGESWGKVLEFYPKAKPEAQRAALKRLVDYFQKPPASISGGIKHHPTNAAEVQDAFKLWLSRRDQTNKLIIDLKAALKI